MHLGQVPNRLKNANSILLRKNKCSNRTTDDGSFSSGYCFDPSNYQGKDRVVLVLVSYELPLYVCVCVHTYMSNC